MRSARREGEAVMNDGYCIDNLLKTPISDIDEDRLYTECLQGTVESLSKMKANKQQFLKLLIELKTIRSKYHHARLRNSEQAWEHTQARLELTRALLERKNDFIAYLFIHIIKHVASPEAFETALLFLEGVYAQWAAQLGQPRYNRRFGLENRTSRRDKP